jgi:protein SCO1/2
MPIRTHLPLAAACALLLAAGFQPAARGHEAHQHAQAAPTERQVAQYRLPPTQLVRSDGATISFPQALDDGRPVALNFIYTSCTAICPVLSHNFAEFQRRLGTERERVHMVSISIDPEEDTPPRLSAYAARFDAGPQWEFYTGSAASSVTMQKAFQAWFGDKMHHRPVTFLRVAPGQPWVRLDGFSSPDELLAEYRRLVKSR